MQTGIESLFVTVVLVENQILGSQYRFAAYIVGIHPLPSARHCTTVEDYHQTMIVSITQNTFVQTHGFLFVSTEKVDFDTFHTLLLEPFHFTLADNRIIHHVDRPLLDIIPVAA